MPISLEAEILEILGFEEPTLLGPESSEGWNVGVRAPDPTIVRDSASTAGIADLRSGAFDALAISMATVSTGGFAPRSAGSESHPDFSRAYCRGVAPDRLVAAWEAMID